MYHYNAMGNLKLNLVHVSLHSNVKFEIKFG